MYRRKPRRCLPEREGLPAGRGRGPEQGPEQALQPADHQHSREPGAGGPARGQDGGAAQPRGLALQVPQQEEEALPHPLLPQKEQKEGEGRGLGSPRKNARVNQGLAHLEKRGSGTVEKCTFLSQKWG